MVVPVLHKGVKVAFPGKIDTKVDHSAAKQDIKLLLGVYPLQTAAPELILLRLPLEGSQIHFLKLEIVGVKGFIDSSIRIQLALERQSDTSPDADLFQNQRRGRILLLSGKRYLASNSVCA